MRLVRGGGRIAPAFGHGEMLSGTRFCAKIRWVSRLLRGWLCGSPENRDDPAPHPNKTNRPDTESTYGFTC
ncbi:hypothetical protein [Roseovarius spongiae]|uniref:hypothetical protein n=1 Tax=Roseovarius spongiae TaxID=2320272 RepID=UPI0011C496B6|nr:hypothetical protein [Roseovarius spongiae]